MGIDRKEEKRREEERREEKRREEKRREEKKREEKRREEKRRAEEKRKEKKRHRALPRVRGNDDLCRDPDPTNVQPTTHRNTIHQARVSHRSLVDSTSLELHRRFETHRSSKIARLSSERGKGKKE